MRKNNEPGAMTISQYLRSISSIYKSGNATEHTYRPALKQLIETLVPGVIATNEPKRQLCGAPDYILTRKEIPLGFIEAKDIGVSLDKAENDEQIKRYKNSLDNLILTDYIEFRLYRNGEKVAVINIAFIENGKLKLNEHSFPALENLVKDFCTYIGQTITSPEKLAKMMAGKAQLMATVLENALDADLNSPFGFISTSLQQQFNAFKDFLIHDISSKQFADIYSQTIAYGMFAARLHDTSLNDFTRREAAELIPKSNPLLRKLFQYVAGYDLDDRLVWIVDALADVFRAADVAAILKNFGKSTQQTDPMIHFYETFLSAYNPAERKKRGVYYTPEPVVNFIVRAVDDILKTEFGLKDGLACTDTTEIDVEVQHKKTKGKRTVHKVQILDPATGTGTFLAEIIKHIYHRFDGQQGAWNDYVEKHLLPRVNGFEILMASYAMCHLKLDMLLAETGYTPQKRIGDMTQRFRVYLTNSLEEAAESSINLFEQWLSNEANEANEIKRDTPVMVVIGNPPYSGESSNKGDWIMNLMEDYKKEPGGIEKLKEKNPKWINDDYVKFIRYGQHFIEKNGEGVLALINPHGFLDNPTFRGMRWNLLNTFDKIYTLDLHGNSKKKETALDGSPDINVFDIQQGVGINIFIKTGKKKKNELGKVFHYDLFGKRELKYNFLLENSLDSVGYKLLKNIAPNFFFVQKDFNSEKKYNDGFILNDLFPLNNVGVVTAKDAVLINESKNLLIKNVEEHFNIDVIQNKIQKISYRPFDEKYIYYDVKIVERAREKIMQHFINGHNVGLNWIRPMSSKYEFSVFISKNISDQCSAGNKSAGAGISYIAPLYLYPSNNNQTQLHEQTERVPNLNMKIVDEICKRLGLSLKFDANAGEENSFMVVAGQSTLSPVNILDYIYAILHSPKYRSTYKEFLKIDFPRIPYANDFSNFCSLTKLGEELRELHLLKSEKLDKLITKFSISGNNVVGKIKFVLNVKSLEIKKAKPAVEKKTEPVVQIKEKPTNVVKAKSAETESDVIVENETFPQPHLSKYGPDGSKIHDELHEPLVAYGNAYGKVYINETQYFDKVPQVAWEFYIGGYQPAQKWLKDRAGRTLSYNDILHYQKMIVALTETHRLMQSIDDYTADLF
ncbi:MAG: type ISP restriction/modification enzyme [Bacteroidia bacterium]